LRFWKISKSGIGVSLICKILKNPRSEVLNKIKEPPKLVRTACSELKEPNLNQVRFSKLEPDFYKYNQTHKVGLIGS